MGQRRFRNARDIPLAEVPDGTRVYAVGDIHGEAELLEKLLKAIAEDYASRATMRNVLVFLGDYVDRGPAARRVVSHVLGNIPKGFTSVALMGNHESMMLRFLDDPETGATWLWNGGLWTVRSYLGIGCDRFLDEKNFSGLSRALAEVLPPTHLAFLRGLRASHEEGGYLFTHAGVRPGVRLADQSPEDMMWIREPFLSSTADFGRVIVHGHSVVATPEIYPNRIALDTGAYANGLLTCIVLEGRNIRFIHT